MATTWVECFLVAGDHSAPTTKWPTTPLKFQNKWTDRHITRAVSYTSKFSIFKIQWHQCLVSYQTSTSNWSSRSTWTYRNYTFEGTFNLLRPTGLPNVFLCWVSRMPNSLTAPILAQQCQCSTTHIHINTITHSFVRQTYIGDAVRVRGIHHLLINALAMAGETSADSALISRDWHVVWLLTCTYD